MESYRIFSFVSSFFSLNMFLEFIHVVACELSSKLNPDYTFSNGEVNTVEDISVTPLWGTTGPH